MNNFVASQHLQHVENAFKLAKTLPHDDEVLSHFTRYLCILCSGYIEASIQAILSHYAKTTATTTAGYVTSQLRRFHNPKVQPISQLVAAFDEPWREVFLSQIQGAPADAVNSIVNNRNKIAHGQDITLSLNELTEYFRNAQKVVELIDDRFHSPGSSPKRRQR